MFWGRRNTSNKYHWHVWGVLTVYGPHWVAPAHSGMCFPGLHYSSSNFLCRGTVQSRPCVSYFPGLRCSGSGSQILHKGTDLVGHAFCALPKSVKLRRPGVWQGHCPQWTVFLNLLPGLSCSVFWVHHKSAISGVLCVSSGELISGCDFPGRCHLSRIPGRVG